MRKFEAYEDQHGRWRWRLWHDETIIASSGESFPTQGDALAAAEAVRTDAAVAEIATEPGLGVRAAMRLRSLLDGGERRGRRELSRLASPVAIAAKANSAPV